MKQNKAAYWLCQIGGWSAYCLIYTFFYFTIRTKAQPHFFQILFVDAISGLLITHVMRMAIRQLGFVKMNVQKQIIALLLTSFVFAFMYSFSMVYLEDKVFHLMENDQS